MDTRPRGDYDLAINHLYLLNFLAFEAPFGRGLDRGRSTIFTAL
jgi:hypothetical protein